MKYILTEDEYKALSTGPEVTHTNHESLLAQYKSLSTSHRILGAEHQELQRKYQQLAQDFQEYRIENL